MKKIFTLLAAFAATFSAMAQMPSAMTFAGKANFYVNMQGTKMGETQLASDTIIYEGSKFTLPSIQYNMQGQAVTIPSFTIDHTTFTGGYAGVTWDHQEWTAQVGEMSFSGTDLNGRFTHADNVYKLTLELTFKYGKMPFPITYSIEGYYVKPTTQPVAVMVGGAYGPYANDSVTFDSRIYEENGTKLLDVSMHTYSLAQTAIGDLTLGAYTVSGLVYDDERGGFYRNYTDDGLRMHFATSSGIDGIYELGGGDKGNKKQELLVIMQGTSIAYARNAFQPGAMPFPIEAIFGDPSATGITSLTQSPAQTQAVKRIEKGRMVIEKDGKKYDVMGRRIH